MADALRTIKELQIPRTLKVTDSYEPSMYTHRLGYACRVRGQLAEMFLSFHRGGLET